MRHQVSRPISWGAAGCFLTPYLLPHTVWSEAIPIKIRYWLEEGCFTIPQAALVILLLLFAWLSYRNSCQAKPERQQLWILLGIVLAIFAVTCFHMPPVAPVIATCTGILLALGAGLMGVRLCGDSKTAAKLLILFGIVQSGYAVVGYLKHTHVMLSGSLLRAGGTFDQPTQLSFVMIVILPFLFAILTDTKSVLWLTMLAFAVALCSAVLLLTGSRGAILGMLASLILQYSLHIRNKGRLQVLVVSVCLIIVASMMLIATNRLRNASMISVVSTQKSSQGHLQYWLRGGQVFVHHWLTGTGAGSTLIPIPVIAGGVTQEIETLASNNLIIQWLAEFGIMGGVLLVLIASTINCVLRSEHTALAIGIYGSWAAFFVDSLFNVSYGRGNPPGGVLIGALFGITLMLPMFGNQHKRVAGHDIADISRKDGS